MAEVGVAESEVSLAGKYLTFALAGERYGLQILKVQEIIGLPTITRVPRSRPYLKGVINLRGKIIPVIDLRTKFGLVAAEYDERTCIIVVNLQAGEQRLALGVIVDTVLEVINFMGSEIEAAPDFGMQLDNRFILGMGKRDSALCTLIDIERALSQDDSNALGDMVSESPSA